MNTDENSGNTERPRKINPDQIQIIGEGEHSSHRAPDTSNDGANPSGFGRSGGNTSFGGNPAFGKSVVWVSKGGPVAWIFGLALLPLFLLIGLFIFSIFMIFQFTRIFSSKR